MIGLIGRSIRLIPTLKSRRAWSDILQALRKHKCQPRLLYHPKNAQLTLFRKKTRCLKSNPNLTNICLERALQKTLEGNSKLRKIYISTNRQKIRNIIQKKRGMHTHTTTTTSITITTNKINITANSNIWWLIYLNINGLNSQIKRQRLRECMLKQDASFWYIQETHLKNNNRHFLRVKGWKIVFQAHKP